MVFGAYEPGTNRLFDLRARIARLGKDAREAALLHDGEGTITDVSRPSERVIYALVRRVKQAPPDVVRDYWLLGSSDAGLSWRQISFTPMDSVTWVEFTDERHGWVIGYQGTVMTDDAGATWSAVADPPRPELEKNLLGLGGEGGAVSFRAGTLEVRDRQLALKHARSLGLTTKVQCFARMARDRLLAITRARDAAGTGHTGALTVRLPDLQTIASVSGLPDDFLCGAAAGGYGVAVIEGARLKTAGVWGISREGYSLTGDGPLRRFRLREGSETALAIDRRSAILAQIARVRGGFRAQLYRIAP